MSNSRKRADSVSTAAQSQVKSSSMHEQIAALAYLKAEARGFSPGRELEDWLEAEQEVNGSAASKRKH